MAAALRHGFSLERLARLDRFLDERYVSPGRLPCVQLLICRRGEVVHETVLGWRYREHRTPATADTIYRIYSMTKPITSVAFMTLVEEGRAALDDPVSKWLPAFEGAQAATGAPPDAAAARPMLLVDLLRHTSGLTYGFQQRTQVDAAYRKLDLDNFHGRRTLDEFVEALASLPLDFAPGEAWNYSVSTDVLGAVIEKVAGAPLSEVLRERIFDPLAMADTGFHVAPGDEERFAACYRPTRDGGVALLDDPRNSPFLRPPAFPSGGGGLVSTAADFMRFANMLVGGGTLAGAQILAPSTVRLMRQNHLPGGRDLTELSRSMFSESANAGVGFGLGFAVAFDPARALLPSSPGEYYWGGLASTAFWIDPVEEVSVVFMTQLIPSSTYAIRRELRSLVYAALVGP